MIEQKVSTSEELKSLSTTKAPLTESQLGARLVSSEIIDKTQLREILREKNRTGKSFLEAMTSLGLLHEANAPAVLASKLGIPRVRVGNMDISEDVLHSVPADVITRYRAFPLGIIDGRLIVAMTNPLDIEAIQTISFASNHIVDVVLTTNQELQHLIDRYLFTSTEDEILSELNESFRAEKEEEVPAQMLIESAERKPVVKFVDTLLYSAIASDASDVNIRPTDQGADIFYRIDGKMVFQRSLSRREVLPIVSRIKIVSGMNIAERRLPQDGHTMLAHRDKRIDFRVSIIPMVTGESVVIRILDDSKGLISLDSLGLPAPEIARMRDVLSHSYGIFLVSGPTGSGKTTTLYAVVNERRAKNPHIITVEDPVEYRLDGVEQIQIKPKIGYTFAEALRHILRHDPDEILIGEMRDFETAEIAVKASLTGHFVMSTLHTNDAASSVTRLIDMGIPNYLINSTLVGVLSQRLVRKICPHCCEDDTDEAHLKAFFQLPDDFPAKIGHGCVECHKTGYKGRLMVGELLVVTQAMRDLISESAGADKLKEQAMAEGMTSLTENALEMVRNGVTSLEEVFRVRQE